jgi:hypothetical protein
MNNILKAQYKRSFNRQRGATLHPLKKMFPHCSLIKFTGTPDICIIYVPFVPITLIRILLLIEIFLLSGFDKGALILSVLLNATSVE